MAQSVLHRCVKRVGASDTESELLQMESRSEARHRRLEGVFGEICSPAGGATMAEKEDYSLWFEDFSEVDQGFHGDFVPSVVQNATVSHAPTAKLVNTKRQGVINRYLSATSAVKKSRKRVVRDRRYFAEATRKCREKKRQQREELKQRNYSLEQEKVRLKRKIEDLRNQVESLVQLPTGGVSERNNRLLLLENDQLRAEVKRHRNLALSFKNFFSSLQAQSFTTGLLITRQRVVNKAAQELFQICHLSLHDSKWNHIEPSGGFLNSGPLSRCKPEFRSVDAEIYCIRQDLFGIPIEFDNLCKVVDEFSKPENVNLMNDNGEGPDVRLKQGVRYEVDLIETNVSEEWSNLGRSDIIYCSENLEAEEYKYDGYLVRSTSIETMSRNGFPSNFAEKNAWRTGDQVEVKVHMFSTLPVEVRKLLSNDLTSPATHDAMTGSDALHGLIFSRGRNGTTNLTFISRFPSWR